MDSQNNFNILNYTSYKAKGVTRSVLGAETYAIADALDFAIIIRNDLKKS